MSTPPIFRATCKLTPATGGDPVAVEAYFADFCPREYEPGQVYCCAGEPVWADPPLADGPIKNNVRGKVAIIARGEVDFLTKAKYAAEAGAVGVIFENDSDALTLPSAGDNPDTVQIPCILIKKSAMRDKRLSASAGYGRAVPTHANPDGPSFCIVTPATMGPKMTVDFQALVEGLPGQFEDKDFPPDSSSLYVDPRSPMQSLIGKKIEWLRPEQLSRGKKPELFQDGTDPGDIIQGSVGDCFFLSAASILASSESAHLLSKLFIKTQYFDQGLVAIRFFKDGEWRDVAIDTLIPCLNGQPVFVRMSDPSEFWMIMLEKAYAKIHGCYESLDGGHMNEALTDMTGGAPGRVKVTDLFRLATSGGRVDKTKALGLLASKAKGELLQGASSDAGGSEEAVGHGIYSGHAYSINAVNSIKIAGRDEVLVRCRNPWGSHEWTGGWCDSDPRWKQNPKEAAEVGHSEKDDGMFFIGIDDFVRTFTSITYVDLVPPTWTNYRVSGVWNSKTGGGCCNYPTWKNNPQILMRVPETCSVNLCLDQADARMKCKSMGKAAWDELNNKGGYDHYIAFGVYKGNAKKRVCSERDMVAEASYINTRSVSHFIEALPRGDYIIIPTTFEPGVDIKFFMRIIASAKIELIDTDGGEFVEINDASQDQIDKAAVPMSLAKQMGLKSATSVDSKQQKIGFEDVEPDEEMMSDHNRVKKHEFADEGQEAFSGLLSGLGESIKKTVWKVGERVPSNWEMGKDFAFKPDNTFEHNEIVVMHRSDKSMRFGKIVNVNGGTYTIDVTYTATGPLQKVGVPPAYIGKLPGKHGIPQAMIDQIGSIFDTLDIDGSGALEVAWDSQELSGDLAKRLLMEMQIPQNSMADLYKAMRTLDANGDGKIDKDEFVSWFAQRSLELA